MASNNRRELTIVLTGDAKGLTGTVKVIDAEMKKLGGSFDVVAGKARNAGKEADDAAKRIESSNKRTAAAIGLVVSATVVGFTALVKHQLDVADATGKMAQRLGVSTEFLSGMGYAAKSSGADMQVLDTSLQSLAESQLKAAGGNKQFSAAFAALRVPIKDANGDLKSLADLLPMIAERFRAMPDGANKAALAAKLFGAEGAKLIPMLNQGAEGLAAMSEEAAKLGLVLSKQATDDAAALNDQLARMKDMAVGLANQFLSDMLPALQALSDGMGNAAQQGSNMAEVADVLAGGLKGLVLVVGTLSNGVQGMAEIVAAAITAMGIAIDATRQNFAKMGETHDKVQSLILHGHIGDAITAWKQGLIDMGDTSSTAFDKLVKNGASAVDALKSQAMDVQKLYHQLFPSDAEKGQLAIDADTAALRKEMDRNHAALMAPAVSTDWNSRTDAAAAYERQLKAVSGAYAKLADIQDKLEGKSDPLTKAWTDSAAAIRSIAAQGAILIKNGQDEATVQALVSAAIDDATTARNHAIDVAKRQMDVSGRMIEQMQQEADLAVLNPRDQAIARAGQDYEINYRERNLKLTQDQKAADKERVEEMAAATFDLKKMADEQNQIAQEYAGFWENAAGSISKSFGDLITGQTRSWKDFGKSLKSIAQQFVSDLISQFIRLRVLGPLLSGAMSGVAGWFGIRGDLSGSALSIANAYYGGGSTVGTTAGSMGGAGGVGGSNSYGGMLSNISTLKSMYSYLAGGGSYATGAGNVASVGVGANGTAVAANPYATTYAGPYGGSTSAAMGGVPYASIAGGIMGAYYGAHQGGGGFSTGVATVGYGAAGAALAGTAAGVAGGASLGTAATGAFGAAAASTSWVPIVGWILAAAAIVDHFTGGKVFGTKFATGQANLNLGVDPNGANASASLDQWKYHTGVVPNFMGALTGGWSEAAKFGTKEHRTVNQPVTPEMLKAAQMLYDNIESTLVKGATKLGVEVPEMLTANILAQTKYDKKGKNKGTEYIVDYLGRTWKEATADLAAQRLGAEALVKVVQASAGAAAQTIAEQFRSSADTLLDGANLMLEAQSDINKGNSLLALGTTATLAQVVQFTQGMQQEGEKLADTYNRLMQASAAYLQFVGQFAPVSTGFGSSLQAIAKQMKDNIDQANALAQAAGLQHAKESDLANIHQYAAKQAAAAIAQLSSAAQDLASKLYDVTGNSLAAVNALLDKMSSKVQTAAQMAIGDNSPLSGKEKLDVALKGLRSGVTSADDVLSLGRKLYSSSADYAGLYAKVQDILQLPGAGETGTAGINAALDDYNKLVAQRDQYQTAANATSRFTDAKTLAQYVADISTTHGIGYGEAASGLGFSLQDLAKDLGVTNLTGYLDNLKLADIPGTTMDASASIVDAIHQLGRDLIQTITGGPITAASVTSGVPVGSNDPQVIALLAAINDRLAEIKKSSDATAKTNDRMAKQGDSVDLRGITRSIRTAAR